MALKFPGEKSFPSPTVKNGLLYEKEEGVTDLGRLFHVFPLSFIHKKEFVCSWESFDGDAEHRPRSIDGDTGCCLDVQSLNRSNQWGFCHHI